MCISYTTCGDPQASQPAGRVADKITQTDRTDTDIQTETDRERGRWDRPRRLYPTRGTPGYCTGYKYMVRVHGIGKGEAPRPDYATCRAHTHTHAPYAHARTRTRVRVLSRPHPVVHACAARVQCACAHRRVRSDALQTTLRGAPPFAQPATMRIAVAHRPLYCPRAAAGCAKC